MTSSRVRPLAVATLVASTLVFGAACSSGGSSSSVDAGGSGTTAPAVKGTTPGTEARTNGSTKGTEPPGTATTEVGAGTDASSTTVAGQPGATTTAPAGGGATTTSIAGGGGGPVTTPKPVTTTAPATTTTAAAKPTLQASGPDGNTEVHCMGAQATTQITVQWTATNATDIAVANKQTSDAFTDGNVYTSTAASGSYNLFGIPCSSPSFKTTVTARGPGGSTSVVTNWTIHHM